MSKVVFDISMSLDGFIAAAGRTPEEPMGEGGERLHEWAFEGEEREREILAAAVGATGAIVVGRRTYDDSLPWWGADGPTGQARVPVVVVTHEAPAESPEGGVYTFVTDGIEAALEQAKAAAGDKNVAITGASMGQQYLRAGLLNELSLHLVPVLFGDGVRLFDNLGDGHIELEPLETLQTRGATHLRYRVVK